MAKADMVKALISIHAPREGGDMVSGTTAHNAAGISIHAPREGGDWERR